MDQAVLNRLEITSLPDVVPPEPAHLVPAANRAPLANFAPPDELLGREAELSELVQFCAGTTFYAWWQAGPWAGKSALMSSFALDPPAGTDVVSFFVTSPAARRSQLNTPTSAPAARGGDGVLVTSAVVRWSTHT